MMFLSKLFGRKDSAPVQAAPARRPAAPGKRIDVGLRPDSATVKAPAADGIGQAKAAAKVVSLKDARQAAVRVSETASDRALIVEAANDTEAEYVAPVIESSAPVPRASDVPKTLTSTSDLPPHLGLVSTAGPLEVNEKLRKELAVLKVDETGSVAIIVTLKQHKGAYYLNLVDRIKAERCRVVFEGIADSGLITSLYAGARRLDDGATDSSRSRDFDELVARGIDLNASDIHIMCRHDKTEVKMRRNGNLEKITTWNSEYAREMARSIHAMADEDTKEATFSESEGQSMMVARNIGGQWIQLRVQTSPAYPSGMDIVMRILKSGSEAKPIPLEKLGYARSHIDMINYMMRIPGGLILVAGETGSGKSTTLFTMMTTLALENDGLKIYTVEDPPEYNMERYGITQIPVNRKRNDTGNPFNKNLRNLMRMDLDMAMVGEIRDADSGEAVVNLVRSGHKMVSTLHAAGALSILERMRSFGVDTQTMTSRGFIAGLVTQRLSPTLCPHCKRDYNPGLSIGGPGLHDRIKAVTTEGDTLFVKGPGCEHCDNTGISGQTVLAEMLIPDGKMLELLRNEKFYEAYEYWRGFRQPTIADIDGSMAGMTMLEHGILKMRLGLIAPDELERRVGPMTEGHEVDEAIISNETKDLLAD